MGCREPRAHPYGLLTASNINSPKVFRDVKAVRSDASDPFGTQTVVVELQHSLLRCCGLATNHRSVAAWERKRDWTRATPFGAGSAA